MTGSASTTQNTGYLYYLQGWLHGELSAQHARLTVCRNCCNGNKEYDVTNGGVVVTDDCKHCRPAVAS